MEYINYRKKIIKLFYLFIALFFDIKIASAQESMIVMEKSPKTIEVFKKFDSVILIKAESFWKEDKSFLGLGFKNQQVSYLTGDFKYNKKVLNGAKLKRQKKIHLNTNILDLKKIRSLNKDSLNNFIDYTSGKKVIVSNGILYSLITIDNIENRTVVKESYKARSYQHMSPNNEREYFMDIFHVFESLCQCALIKD